MFVFAHPFFHLGEHENHNSCTKREMKKSIFPQLQGRASTQKKQQKISLFYN